MQPIENDWSGGLINLVFPLLASHEIGASGVKLLTAQFEALLGAEYYLQILEDPEWASRYGSVRVLTLSASTLVISTDAGPVAIILWQLLDGAKSLVHYEHFLDPCGAATQPMLHRVGQQKRLKVVIRSNHTGATAGFWDIENSFCLGDFGTMLVEGCAGMTAGSMEDRITLVRLEYPIRELIRLTRDK